MLYAIVGLLFLLADQFLKFWTVSHIELEAFPGKELIPGVLDLGLHLTVDGFRQIYVFVIAFMWTMTMMMIASTIRAATIARPL